MSQIIGIWHHTAILSLILKFLWWANKYAFKKLYKATSSGQSLWLWKTFDRDIVKWHNLYALSKALVTLHCFCWWMPFSDEIIYVRCCHPHRASKSQQAPSTCLDCDIIYKSRKLTNNQKYWLTSFIWSKVNVQNNKKHGSKRDMVQCKSTGLAVHSAPISSEKNKRAKKGH